MKKGIFVFLLGVLICFKVNGQSLTLYENKYRMFKVLYPSELIMGPQPANSDGRRFNSIDSSCTMLAYSAVESTSDHKLIILYYQTLTELNDNVTYSAFDKNYFIISGTYSNGKIFYRRTYFSTKHDEFRTYIIEYSKSLANKFNVLIPKINSSFVDL